MSASKVFLATLTFAAVLVASSVQAAFTVSSDEIWDGVSNPHSADGVTLTVVGTAPAVVTYNIPTGMTIDPGVTVFLTDPAFDEANDKTITWNFTGDGGLTFADVDSTINVHKGLRGQPGRPFTLNMNNNPISGTVPGAGRLVSLSHIVDFLAETAEPASGLSRSPFGITINSMNNVTVGTLDTSVVDAVTTTLTINAHGTVDVDNLGNGDFGAGGGGGQGMNITGGALILGNINGQAVRGTPVNQGNINLRALAQPANSVGNFAQNTAAANTITLDGFVNLKPPTNTSNGGGNLTLNTVKATLTDTFVYAPNATDTANAGMFTVNAGEATGGFTQEQLFINNSEVTFPTAKNIVNFTVFHDNNAPTGASWANNISGNWHTEANWAPVIVPNVNQTTATFGSAITSPRTIFLNAGATVKGLEFSTTSKVVIGGTAGLTLEADTGSASITVSAASSPEIDVQLTLNSNTVASTVADSALNINGVLNLNGNTLTITGAGAVNINNSVTGVGSIAGSGATLGVAGPTSLVGDLSSTGTLAIDVSASNTYDSWNVIGDATLSGVLAVDVVDDFAPLPGQTFTVLTANSINAEDLTLGGPDAALFSLIRTSDSLVLQAAGTVPEPTSTLLVLAALAMMAAGRRRF